MLGSHCFISIVYFIIHTYARRTHLFIYTLTAIQHLNLFYTEFSGDDCPRDAVDFEVKDGYTIIGECAFQNCVSLKTIKLPKYIKTINASAFFKCMLLQTIDLPLSLTTLGMAAFYNCSSL